MRNGILFSCALFAALASGCAPSNSRPPRTLTRAEWTELEARSVLAAMTPDERASQVLMACVAGKDAFSPAMRERFRGRVPGAILLFGYNIAPTPERVRSFVDSCDASFEALGARASVLFAVDHEGGDVVRTRGLTSPLPSARSVAETLDERAAERLYELSGTQLAELGIDLNLAPVAEPLDGSNDAFLGTRSYSADPRVVVAYAAAAVRGYRSAGIMVALKHFPGNGAADPHAALPRVDVSSRDLTRTYAAAFASLIAEKPDAILVSHVVVPSVDERPFCLSRAGVTGVLRERLGYDGVVITDDVEMAALGNGGYSAPEAAVLAIEAGCDLVMTSSPSVGAIVGALSAKADSDPAFSARLDEAVLRILKMKAGKGLVKTARERYGNSRYGSETSAKKKAPFDARRFYGAKEAARALLGGE